MAFFISKMWDARDFVNVALAVVDRVSHDEISWQRHYPGRLGDLVQPLKRARVAAIATALGVYRLRQRRVLSYEIIEVNPTA